MKAVIMAGGEGTRLRPLTCDCPKPMARLCGRPIIEYIIEQLSHNGITEAIITLRYLPRNIIDHFEKGSFAGVKLSFVEEDRPLGTAGGVRNALSGDLEDGIVVVSGDAINDFNLSAAMRSHKERQAAATLIMTHVGDPREYGLVVTEPSGLIRGFVEKPGWAQSVTDAVNSGCYILSPESVAMIPENTQFDFAKDLFPVMLSQNMPLYGFEAEGYWCDIGDIGAYVSCQFDMLEGKVECSIPGRANGQIYSKGALPAGNYNIQAPVYIGEGVRIGEYSQIGPYAVIDDGCSIGTGSTVKNSVLLRDVYVGEHCELRGALLCDGASLKKRAGMFEGSVAGSKSIVGRDASVSPGVRIWPGKRVEDGARAAVNLKFGTARRGMFDDEGVTGEVGIDMTPELCAKLGAAVGEGMPAGIATGHDGSPAGQALINAVNAGAASAGARVFDIGSCFEALFSFAVPFIGLDMGIFARTAGSRAVLRLVDGNGLTLSRAQERKIDASMTTGETARCEADQYTAPYSMTGVQAIYESRIRQNAPEGLSGINANVRCSNRAVQRLLAGTFRALGCGEGGIRVHLTASGGEASFFDENGRYIDSSRALALGCLAAFEEGLDVALPYDSPRVIDSIAARYGKSVLRYLSCPADGSDKAARELAAKQPWVRDGLQNALRILALLRRKRCRLSELAEKLPPFALAVKAVPVQDSPGNLLRRLSKESSEQEDGPKEGVMFTRGGGRVLISPLKRGSGLRIMAEAASMEAADELCGEFINRIQYNEILDKNSNQG